MNIIYTYAVFILPVCIMYSFPENAIRIRLSFVVYFCSVCPCRVLNPRRASDRLEAQVGKERRRIQLLYKSADGLSKCPYFI